MIDMQESGSSLRSGRDSWALSGIQAMVQQVLEAVIREKQPLPARMQDMVILADNVVLSRKELALWYGQDADWDSKVERKHEHALEVYRTVLHLLRAAAAAGRYQLETALLMGPCGVQ